jgi:dolichol-phosphate mannosyltransferase
MASCTVVIPAHNEEDTIGGLVECALVHADRVIVANDSSTDRTEQVAEEAGAIVALVPRERRGLVGVYSFGLRVAVALHRTAPCGGRGAYVCEMDAGGSHDPHELPKFWKALDEGADIAAGCRFAYGGEYLGSWQRKSLSYFGTKLTNIVHGTKWCDATSGFVAYRSSSLDALLQVPYKSTGHYYQTEMRLRAQAMGMKTTEVPITYRNSGSSLNWRSIREALSLVMR